MQLIDLRSDTVTKPTPEMRQAMTQAPVGDDVYGEDPSVNRLQELGAQMMGKEAGLFIPSGTMGNLAAILAHCTRGDEVILGKDSHTFLFEAGGIAALGGVHPNQIPNQPDGTLALNDIRDNIRGDDPHLPITRLISLENTHNRCGDISLSLEYTRSVSELARTNNLRVHMDGARIFNAAVAQGVRPDELVEQVDSVTFCLSKGLCAPVGSVLCGSREFIDRAHRIRKQLGGGMRQAGIIAAAGIVALESMVGRLPEDHRRAKRLAEGLTNHPCIEIDPGSPYTNMVFITLVDGSSKVTALEVSERLAKNGVLVGTVAEKRFRLVSHNEIDDDMIDQSIDIFNKVLTEYI